VRPNGEVRWILDQGFPVVDSQGKLQRYVGVARDITERKSAQEQLRQAQKLEAVGQLAGGVAHDFNNVLVVIMLEAQLAEAQAGVSEEVRRGLREIRLAAERAASLSRQLLLFSSRQVMQPCDLDLNHLVRNLSKMLQRIIGEDIRLELRLHPGQLI